MSSPRAFSIRATISAATLCLAIVSFAFPAVAQSDSANYTFLVGMVRRNLVRPERFELPACCSGGNRSIQLSYGRTTNTDSLHGQASGLQC